MVEDTKLRRVLSAVLGVPADAVDEHTSADTVPHWDSLRQMDLILALEEEFDVTIPDEDAAQLTSYPLIKVVLEEQVAA